MLIFIHLTGKGKYLRKYLAIPEGYVDWSRDEGVGVLTNISKIDVKVLFSTVNMKFYGGVGKVVSEGEVNKR